ncbi:MAG: ribose 5-phosphate isomerase A [Pseudomonadota bacterium]
MSIDQFKQRAAEKAVEQVKSGMTLGLGSGSTVSHAVIKIGQLWQSGELANITGVPTSERTETLARQYNIPLTTLDSHPNLDLAIDGADEVDPHLNLIKGLGGALLREKMVELTAKYFIVVVDDTKPVKKIGTRGPLPVEVVQFSWRYQANWLATLGCTPTLRGGEAAPFVTDNGNYILDCTFPQGIDDPAGLARTLNERTGVVEHGLFLNMADEVIVAGETGLQFIN